MPARSALFVGTFAPSEYVLMIIIIAVERLVMGNNPVYRRRPHRTPMYRRRAYEWAVLRYYVILLLSCITVSVVCACAHIAYAEYGICVMWIPSKFYLYTLANKYGRVFGYLFSNKLWWRQRETEGGREMRKTYMHFRWDMYNECATNGTISCGVGIKARKSYAELNWID